MSNQICLKWNSFLNNIATSFESLWEEEGLVDVTLASDGQCLTAHKVILSASSPFFKKVFQANPCQHPVIILQDVHFRELEALLIFIYKGEVNIEQQNLPALLKAAETLKIRGLSGGDMFAKESYKRLVDLEKSDLDDVSSDKNDETPKKKLKVGGKKQNDSILEKALNTRSADDVVSAGAVAAVDVAGEETFKETDSGSEPVLLRLEMKTEPLEILVGDFQKHSCAVGKDALERLDTGQGELVQGSGNSPAEEISGLSGLSTGMPGITGDKPLVGGFGYQRLPYADLLPNPEVIATWATSRPMDHLACDLMKILFTPEERILCNVNGKMGKQQFDGNKIHLIREVLIHFSGIPADSVEWEEAWKNCVTKIDTRGSSKRSVSVTTETRDTSSLLLLLPGSSPANDSPDDDEDRDEDKHRPDDGPPTTTTTTTTTDETSPDYAPNLAGRLSSYPPFPCPFCDRAYTSWGFRRRHIKAVHTASPMLNCKWCSQVLPSHAAWQRHVVSEHDLLPGDAQNGLLILEEANMVLQIARPTRLDAAAALVGTTERTSRRNDEEDRG